MQGSPSLLPVILLLLAVFFVLQMCSGGDPQLPNQKEITFTEFLGHVEGRRVTSVVIQNDKEGGSLVRGSLTDGTYFRLYTTAGYPPLIDILRHAGVQITFYPPPQPNLFVAFLLTWFPMLLLIGVWIYFMRKGGIGGGGGTLGNFLSSKARLLRLEADRITFADVAGVDEAKQEVIEIVEFLRDPHKFLNMGAKIPKGILLVGPPGTGKTLLARAIAGEANVPFFTIAGSDFVEMFVGVGASRVRGMFEQGRKNAPCIIFIDELDAVGRHRGAGLGGGNDEREQTLNQILVEMDGFDTKEGVILIAATNRPDVLDPALIRPGRFDRQVVVPPPDILGREKILEIYLKKVPCAVDVDAKVLARGTPGFVGADLANLVNEGALYAARRGGATVTMSDFEFSKDKVMMGAERRSLVMTDEEKRRVAYHEAGHALLTVKLSPPHDPLHKVTIISRGRALGVTMPLPERDHLIVQEGALKARLVVAFGGRVAEKIVFDDVTTGASNDIEQATIIARKMVTEFGMSTLGPIRFEENEGEVFLGRAVTQRKNMSEETARRIDEEVRRLVSEAEQQAHTVITQNREGLTAVAEALLERETLTGDEVKILLLKRT